MIFTPGLYPIKIFIKLIMLIDKSLFIQSLAQASPLFETSIVFELYHDVFLKHVRSIGYIKQLVTIKFFNIQKLNKNTKKKDVLDKIISSLFFIIKEKKETIKLTNKKALLKSKIQTIDIL